VPPTPPRTVFRVQFPPEHYAWLQHTVAPRYREAIRTDPMSMLRFNDEQHTLEIGYPTLNAFYLAYPVLGGQLVAWKFPGGDNDQPLASQYRKFGTPQARSYLALARRESRATAERVANGFSYLRYDEISAPTFAALDEALQASAGNPDQAFESLLNGRDGFIIADTHSWPDSGRTVRKYMAL